MFGMRKPYRRPAVNYIPDYSDYYKESLEELVAKFCGRCSIRLGYVQNFDRKIINNFMCPTCGWQPLKKKRRKKQS
jgi:hypothetical protein